MTLSEFKNLLEQHPDKGLVFYLPDETAIPVHFHITEVGHVRKDFIDCGGTQRTSSTCVLQAWVADDLEHALSAGKLADILGLAEKIFPSGLLPVEIEFETPLISQFPIASSEVAGNTVVFHLATKHTDCLAKEKCGLNDTCCGGEPEKVSARDNDSCCSADASTCCS